MDNKHIAGLLEQRRTALLEFSIGQVKKGLPPNDHYKFLRTPADVFELLRMDPLDNYPVQNSWVAALVSSAQNFIHAAYRKLEPGYAGHEFDKRDLKTWGLYSNYSDWAALVMIALYPENYITPYVRRRKTRLFQTLESELHQTRLSVDSVQVALKSYLQAFEQTCNLEVISCYMDGTSLTTPLSPTRADYYFVGRLRVPPYQYYWRKAEVELTPSCRAINPAVWGEWQPVEIPAGDKVLDMRLVSWGGRLCLVWAEWFERIGSDPDIDIGPPFKLEINLAFMAQNGLWSAPLSLHSSGFDKDVSVGSRLIATVLVDNQHPKGKLGVLLTNRSRQGGAAPANPVDVYQVRDILFRSVADDDGGWLSPLADHRFVGPDTVQHPILQQNIPTFVDTNEPAGTLTPHYSFQAVVLRVGTEDVLLVRGLCAVKPGPAGSNKDFDLTLLNGVIDDPKPISGAFSSAGGWSTPWMAVRRTAGGFTGPTSFTFGGSTPADGLGRKKYVVTVGAVVSFVPPSLDKTNLKGAQFLTLNQPELTLKQVRLNSLFGPELVQRATVSVDALLDWETQHLKEPDPASSPIDEPNGAFDGANGLFFWELFFHLPHLVASRLSTENRFLEAQQWLHYLFDPQAPADSTTTPPKPLYWRCRPLTGPGNLGCEAEAPTDPDAIGYSAPRHFQIVAFTEYVKNLIAWGDWYYRQLTRDSLVAARLCYVQARFLMGKAPTARAVNRWEPKTVAELLVNASARPALETFEKNLMFTLADVPAKAEVAPELGLLGVKGFELPINERLMELFALPDSRLHNLRNNLTLDGKPLLIPDFSPPTDPNQLLQDLAAGAGSPRPMGGQLVLVAFRWRVMYEAALRAVQTLQDHGNQVLRLLEQRDRTEMEGLQHNHLVDLGTYAQTVQEQTIEQQLAIVTALEQSRAVAQERADVYAKKVEDNVSDAEYEVLSLLLNAKTQTAFGAASKMLGAITKTIVPNKAGMSFGVANPGGIMEAVGVGFDIASTALSLTAERTATSETYRRRRNDWDLQRNQAQAEVRAINAQITAQNHAVEAARANLRQTLRANTHALTLYTFIKKRATNADLLNWLLGQLQALHYQAYDAVVSLCRSAQASLSFETGDYDSQIPLPNVWVDDKHGLTAGEHLRVHLVRMEREYLHRHERRLELVKTLSLRQLFNDTVEPQEDFDSWTQALAELLRTGTLNFKLTQLLFDRDHPGHYCRQINTVEVDLPVLVAPYQNVKAILSQVQSITATKASIRSVEYLHKPANAVAPADVRFNLRAGQQIALSVGVGDTGMATVKPDEGLLNPFECAGAVSRWKLNFPRHRKEPQKSMLASLTDIIVRIHYTAKAGDPTFARKVEELVKRVDPDDPDPLPAD